MNDRQGDPFVVVPRFVIEEAPDCIDVYATIRLFANYETGECFPALDTIAEILPVSVSTIQRRISRLVDIGAMSKKRTGRSNVYRFPPNRLVTDDRSDRSPMTDQTGHQSVTNEEPPNENQLTIGGGGRRRDLLWEVFVEIHGEPATKGERGKYNAAVSTLKEAGVRPDEYPLLVSAFTTKHDGLQPAVHTVAQRVGELRHFVNRGPVLAIDLETAGRRARFAALMAEEEEHDATRRLADDN